MLQVQAMSSVLAVRPFVAPLVPLHPEWPLGVSPYSAGEVRYVVDPRHASAHKPMLTTAAAAVLVGTVVARKRCVFGGRKDCGANRAALLRRMAAGGRTATSADDTAADAKRGGALKYYRYHNELPHPLPAKTTYIDRVAGKGWPEQCPPIRAAQSFGWDVVNPFEMRFIKAQDGAWELAGAVEVQSGDLQERSGITAYNQNNSWSWDPNQVLPHRISPHVFPEISHQAKVSTYLYLRTPPGWALLMEDIPNLVRDFRVVTAFLDTDWYFPAHPWHAVIELPQDGKDEVVIPAGELLCRLMPIRRGAYSAAEMDPDEFANCFDGGQQWLQEHGRPSEEDKKTLDITRAYAKVQKVSTFTVDAAPVKEKKRKLKIRTSRRRA